MFFSVYGRGWLAVVFSKHSTGVCCYSGTLGSTSMFHVHGLKDAFSSVSHHWASNSPLLGRLCCSFPTQPQSLCFQCVSLFLFENYHLHIGNDICPGLASACFDSLWGTGGNRQWVKQLALSAATCYVAPILCWDITEQPWGTHAQTYHFTLLDLFKCLYFNGKFHFSCFLGTQIKTRRTKHKTHIISGNNFRHGLFCMA